MPGDEVDRTGRGDRVRVIPAATRFSLSLRFSNLPHDVFISYSGEDKLAADAACATLEAAGIRCWIAPRDILPGAEWGEAIVDAIDRSEVLLLIFSTNANESR